MGIRNLRAICPNCGSKIHTRPRGLGHVTWMNSGPLVQTGRQCPMCGIALTGRVDMSNVAIAAASGQEYVMDDEDDAPWRRSTQGDLFAAQQLEIARESGQLSYEEWAPQRSLIYPKVDDYTDTIQWFYAMNGAGFILDSEFAEVEPVLEAGIDDPDLLAEFAWVWSGRFRLAVEGEITFEQYFEEQDIMLGRHLMQSESLPVSVGQKVDDDMPSGEVDKVTRLKDLAELKRDGLISEDEFEQLKSEILQSD